MLRFLWFDNVHRKNPKIICLRFTRVVFRVSCNPFLLNAILQYHFHKHVTLHPKMVNKLTASLYVDDVVTELKMRKKPTSSTLSPRVPQGRRI